ncbi:winged helix DNA-binding domain-containing protein [Amycolatopsis aidingensis]|uniref:winged helix DNA-binding domain-containing protein n=1 Tax=Amycolatopsis aidingensis TaxID=2842453 RepID=UPI001C0AA07D|nr:winged helix DNA-binding domain-containing protein [Amycolatopsis aidingensis]
MLAIDREQVLAYRILAHGLHRTGADPAALAVFDLGVQDISQRDSAAVALTARTREPVPAASLVDDPRFTLTWSVRGAPHYHRAAEFPALIPALLPLHEADARARMNWRDQEVAEAGMPAAEALLTAARALREVVGKPMTKGAASAAVTAMVPAGLSRWCRGCQATHVFEQVLRLAAPLAGVRLVAGAAPATLAPVAGRPPVPTEPDPAGATRLATAYLRLHGPATAAEVAGFLGTTKRTVTESLWPSDLVEVRVDGRPAYLPAGQVPELENPPEPDLVRLLPPWDPLLQSRDRLTLVPDKPRHKEIWKIIGNPGALLTCGEIAGTWRTKSAGRRLDVTVNPLWTLTREVRDEVEAEAERVATARGFTGTRVSWEE